MLSACKPESVTASSAVFSKSNIDKELAEKNMSAKATELTSQGRESEAVALMKQYAIEYNDDHYMGAIGAGYALGSVNMKVKPDGKEALYWLNMASSHGNIDALGLLYTVYRYGLAGIEVDYEKALFFLNKTIEKGDIEALAFLGHEYSLGVIVPKNNAKAFDYANQAAQRNNAQGVMLLARFYFEGIGVKKDIKKGLDWVQRAVQLGDADGLSFYGMKLFYGDEYVRKDEALGLAYLTKAAKLEQKNAINELITIYSQNSQYLDKEKALFWKKQVAEKMYVTDMNYLGNIGIGY